MVYETETPWKYQRLLSNTCHNTAYQEQEIGLQTFIVCTIAVLGTRLQEYTIPSRIRLSRVKPNLSIPFNGCRECEQIARYTSTLLACLLRCTFWRREPEADLTRARTREFPSHSQILTGHLLDRVFNDLHPQAI